MNSNKRINLLVDLVKLALVILIACVLVSAVSYTHLTLPTIRLV